MISYSKKQPKSAVGQAFYYEALKARVIIKVTMDFFYECKEEVSHHLDLEVKAGVMWPLLREVREDLQ